MELSWASVKEVFFTIGSIAGVLAILRPIFDSKFKRDQERAIRIRQLLPEEDVVALEDRIYQSRYVSTESFRPYAELEGDVRNNMDTVRFSGPLKKHYHAELLRVLAAYRDLRGYVQVPWWKLDKQVRDDGSEELFWDFDKSQFFRDGTEVRDYAKHLYEAGECAERIKIAYQRLQIVSDMHLLESPLAGVLLSRRYAAHGLQI